MGVNGVGHLLVKQDKGICLETAQPYIAANLSTCVALS